jgi:hypothetical protein
VGHEVGVVSPLDQDAKGRLNCKKQTKTTKIGKENANLAPFLFKA